MISIRRQTALYQLNTIVVYVRLLGILAGVARSDAHHAADSGVGGEATPFAEDARVATIDFTMNNKARDWWAWKASGLLHSTASIGTSESRGAMKRCAHQSDSHPKR